MAKPIPADRAEAIVSAVGKLRTGATFMEVAASLRPLAPMRNVQRWLSVLVRQKRLVRVGNASATRYKLPDAVQPELPLFGSSVGRALHELVTQPLAERARADYRRVALDGYRANETCYLPADIRARIAARRDAGAWRQSPNFERTAIDLVSRCLWLEEAMASNIGVAGLRGVARPVSAGVIDGELTDADLAAWLAQPERPGVRADVQFAWAIRAVLTDWATRGVASAVTTDVLKGVYERLAPAAGPSAGGLMRGMFGAGPLAMRSRASDVPLLRVSPLMLSGTVYEPPADRWLIEACFSQVLRVSGGIGDPVERAFFLLTHLLYLLPFDRCNATMALLTMNLPLIAAGLKPMTFAGVQPGHLLAGIRAVWELNRTELLRDAFGAAG